MKYHKPHQKINPPVTALYFAVHRSQNRIVHMLFEKGASVQGKFEDGNTLLMIAVRAKWHDRREEPDLGIIQFLVAQGVNINARNKKGKTALRIAREEKDEPTTIALLQKAGAKE